METDGTMGPMVHFMRGMEPCVRNDVVLWHERYGWVWNVYWGHHEEMCPWEAIGVFYCTRLCGDGVICHFTPRPEIRIPWFLTLAAFRKGVRMIAPVCDVIYATIPAEKEKLIRVAVRLGFLIVAGGDFLRDGKQPVVLLKYYGHGPQNAEPIPRAGKSDGSDRSDRSDGAQDSPTG